MSVKKAAFIISLFLVFALPFALPVVKNFPLYFEWQGPTATFSKILDINKDGEVSRAEWQLFNLQSNIFNGEFFLLETSDCDQNGRLSWHEYFWGRVKLQKCNLSNSFYELAPRDGDSQDTIFPLLLTESQFVAINSSKTAPYFETLKASFDELPDEIFENNLELDSLSKVSFICEAVKDFDLGIQFGASLENSYLMRTCIVSNNLSDLALTLVVMKIQITEKNQVRNTWHAKSVFMPSNSENRINIIFPQGSLSGNIQLLQIRGMIQNQ